MKERSKIRESWRRARILGHLRKRDVPVASTAPKCAKVRQGSGGEPCRGTPRAPSPSNLTTVKELEASP